MKTVKVPLSQRGIDTLLREIESYTVWLKERSQILLDRLAQAGVEVASARFAKAAYDGTNDASVSLETRGDGVRAVVAVGASVLFIEFGTGVTYPDNHPQAAELGMKNTHFTNATGLTDTEHYSSAADMAKLLQAALHNTTFRTIFTTEHYTTNATAQHPEGVSLTSTLLGKLDGTELPTGTQIEGGKTGYTAAAGLCLASLATVNGKEYILVTLAAPGDHGTEQYNIRDAVHVYRKLADKK